MRTCFILNPTSGTGRSRKNLEALIADEFSQLDFSIVYTKAQGHATALAAQAAEDGYTHIVAVGGDGTVSEVATALRETDASLCVLPTGSGNGFARHFGIPMQLPQAVTLLKSGRRVQIDTATLNGNPFFGFSGVGFDAHISHAFATHGKRGFLTYAKLTRQEIFSYKAKSYSLEIDGETIETDAFLIAITNTSQYGNNVKIAPAANAADGKLNVTVVHPMTRVELGSATFQLFRGTIASNPKVSSYVGENIRIRRAESGAVHLDGEPRVDGELLSYAVVPNSLNVLVPK